MVQTSMTSCASTSHGQRAIDAARERDRRRSARRSRRAGRARSSRGSPFGSDASTNRPAPMISDDQQRPQHDQPEQPARAPIAIAGPCCSSSGGSSAKVSNGRPSRGCDLPRAAVRSTVSVPWDMTRSGRGRSRRAYDSFSISLKIGMYIEMTMPPTMTPRMAIITGSSSVIRPATAVSTSSS